MGRVAFATMEKIDNRPYNSIGSSRIRARWLINHWDEAEEYQVGGKYNVMIFQKAYWQEMLESFTGKKIFDFLESASREVTLAVIKELFAIVYRLDELGINKEEMHHPLKHIIVQSNNKPRLIDYERASYTENPKNLTQFCQFISSGNVSELLQNKNIIIQKQQIIDLARQYKKENINIVYKQIITLFS